MEKVILPTDAAERKDVPLVTGCLDYFPAALAEVAKLSKKANEQHNPGEPMHWARDKSTDHADCCGRHLVDRGKRDVDGERHSTKVAWRALALLQEELEAEGAAPGRASKFDTPPKEQFTPEPSTPEELGAQVFRGIPPYSHGPVSGNENPAFE